MQVCGRVELLLETRGVLAYSTEKVEITVTDGAKWGPKHWANVREIFLIPD